MKYLALLLLLAVAACKSGSENTKQATKIDNLATNAEVQAYVRTVSRYYQSFTLNDFTAETSPEGVLYEDIKKIVDENNITRAYIKHDFDNNGFTDLLVNGVDSHVFYQCLLLMSYGPDKVEITDLISHNSANPVITHAVTLDGMPGIRMHRPNPPRPKGKQVADSITNLCYKFGGFVEYNPKPAQHKIERIQFATSMCYGLCPKFQMNVDAGRHAQFSAVAYNYHGEDESKTLSGFYTGTIDAKAYSQVVDILNYIDFEKLNGRYSVGYSDSQTVHFIITYDGGKTKDVYDYGLMGTYGLHRFYNLMFDLRFSQQWQPAEEPYDFEISTTFHTPPMKVLPEDEK